MKPNPALLVMLSALAGAPALAAPPLPPASPQAVGMSPERLRRLDSFIERLESEGRISGAVTVVARRGRLVRLTAQGYADLESRRPMRPDEIFALASMTKPIATVGLLMLVEEGRVLLSDPVEKFLPEFSHPMVAVPDADGGYVTVPANRSITIHDLLIHRSGLPTPNGLAGQALRQAMAALPPDAVLADRIRALARVPLNFQPGARWEYGVSTDVIGRVIEVVSGQTLDVYLQRRIFEPLGMADTGFTVPPEKRSRLAVIYQASEGGRLSRAHQQPPDTRMFSAAGGLFSTAADYLRFCQMLLNGGALDGRRLLSRKSVELMTERHSDPIPLSFLAGQYFGLGVAVRKADGDSGVLGSPGTYGWSGAYNTYFRIDPREQLILISLLQRSPANDLELQYGFQNVVMQAISD